MRNINIIRVNGKLICGSKFKNDNIDKNKHYDTIETKKQLWLVLLLLNGESFSK